MDYSIDSPKRLNAVADRPCGVNHCDCRKVVFVMSLLDFLLKLPDYVRVVVCCRNDFGHAYHLLDIGLRSDLLCTLPTRFLRCLVNCIIPDYDDEVITVFIGRPRDNDDD